MADAAYVLLTLGGFAALLLLVHGLEALTLDRTPLAPGPDEPAPGDRARVDAAPETSHLETAGRRS
ncbi:hypothetical protein WDV85_04865 [Pseudokineococcus sp. 5B2Z-1]|uniref:hypothetical protein n=1 Tax=Pseudokineococcus sp. 5B2Z-1 TaxID=3132744 RepID=UPI0030A89884